MTEWNAREYYRQSALQRWLADECLAHLRVTGAERMLDVGCGDGKITAEIARRLPNGSIVGVDPSQQMIDFARAHFGAPVCANAAFHVGDATGLPYRHEFDLVVSFNALHWVTDQFAALRSIRDALKPSGRALLQFVPQGPRKSLEDVLEETRTSPQWSGYFSGYRTPFVHPAADAYRAMAEQSGLHVEDLDVQLKAWDFKSRQAFVDFAQVTFVEWTRMLPDDRRLDFIHDVLDNYRRAGDRNPDHANVFSFYQMKVVLRRS